MILPKLLWEKLKKWHKIGDGVFKIRSFVKQEL